MTLTSPSSSWLEITPTGANVRQRPSYQDWYQETEMWLTVYEMSPIVIGDLLNYGEMMWPEMWAQAIDAFARKYAAQTIANYKSVMARVPQAVRHPELSFSHYDAVASLPEPQQRKVLEQVVEQKLGREETRELARKEKGRMGNKMWHAEVAGVSRELRSEGDTVVLEGIGLEDGDLPDGAATVTMRGI